MLSVVAPLLPAGWYLGWETSARRRLIGGLADANAELRAASAPHTRSTSQPNHRPQYLRRVLER